MFYKGPYTRISRVGSLDPVRDLAAGSRQGPPSLAQAPRFHPHCRDLGARCSVRRVVCLAHETRFPSSLIFGTDGCNYRGSGMILFHRNSNCKFN